MNIFEHNAHSPLPSVIGGNPSENRLLLESTVSSSFLYPFTPVLGPEFGTQQVQNWVTELLMVAMLSCNSLSSLSLGDLCLHLAPASHMIPFLWDFGLTHITSPRCLFLVYRLLDQIIVAWFWLDAQVTLGVLREGGAGPASGESDIIDLGVRPRLSTF